MLAQFLVLVFRHQTDPRQNVPQFAEGEPNARFHRAERLLQPFGDFDVRQAFVVRQLDGHPLQHGQGVERRANVAHLLVREDLQVRRHARIDDVGGLSIVNRLFRAGAARPQAIDGPAPGQREQPRGHGAPRSIVLGGLAPGLGNTSCTMSSASPLILQNPESQRVDRPGMAIVQRRQPVVVAASDPFERGPVSRAIVGPAARRSRAGDHRP